MMVGMEVEVVMAKKMIVQEIEAVEMVKVQVNKHAPDSIHECS